MEFPKTKPDKGFAMSAYIPLPSLQHLKQQARRLRAQVSCDATPVSHSQSLELLAHQYGYKDWNTLHAACSNAPQEPLFKIGSRVRGRYLNQPFEGELIAIQSMNHRRGYRVTINFDEPVDVIKFESWSSMRKRVTSQVTKDGRSREKTSDGVPLMQLQL